MDYVGLTYESDQRRDPADDDHEHRLGSFKRGWRAAVEGPLSDWGGGRGE